MGSIYFFNFYIIFPNLRPHPVIGMAFHSSTSESLHFSSGYFSASSIMINWIIILVKSKLGRMIIPIFTATALFSLAIRKRRQQPMAQPIQISKYIGQKPSPLFSLYPNKTTILAILLSLILPCTLECNPYCIACNPQLFCSQCQPGYYISGKFCFPCSGPTGIANCLNCNGYTTSCTICAYGHVVTAPQTCYPCAALSNCLQCTYAPYLLHCTKCATGFTVNPVSTTCITCLSAMTGCATCSSPNYCTSCVNNTFMLYMAQCQPCWQAFYQCYLCNSTNCQKCNNGFYLLPDLTCTPCTTTLSNCRLCLDANNCTECVSNQFYLDVDHCILCEVVFPYCQTCSHIQCLSCLPDFYLNSNLTCKCKKGSPVSGYCIQVPGCNSAMLYQDIPKCLSCATDEFTYNTTTTHCDCRKGILLGTGCSELYGCITMIVANKVQVCLMCNITKNFYLENGRCACHHGYYVSQADNNCKQVCGDGIMISLSCDDGNSIDGDGCSSKCEIEKRFECFNGSVTTPSKCLSILTDFSFELLEVSKVPESNTAQFEFRITNFDPYLSIINWKDLISLEIAQNHEVMDMSLRGNYLTIRVKYEQDLEGKEAKLMLNLSANYFLSPNIINYTFLMTSSNAPLVIMTYPSPFTLQILSILLLCLCILALLLLFVGAALHKMVGVQTLSVFQVLAAAPYLITDQSAVLRLFDSFFLANGFGKSIYYSQDSAQTFGEAFQDLGLPKSFTENMVINEGVLISSAILSALGLIAAYCVLNQKKNQRASKLRYFVKVFCNNILFALSIAFFFVTFVSANANNFRAYQQTYSGTKFESTSNYQRFNPYLNASASVTVILTISMVNVLHMTIPATRKEAIVDQESPFLMKFYLTFQTLKLKNKLYVTFFTINHLIAFSLIAIFVFKPAQYAIFVLFFSMAPFSLCVIIFRPYTRMIDNLGVCVGHAILLLFISSLATKQLLWIFKILIPLNYEIIACIIFTILLTVLIGLSLARLISILIQKGRKRSNIKEPLIQPKNPEARNQSMYDIRPLILQRPLNKLQWGTRDTQELIRLKNQLKNNLIDKGSDLFRNTAWDN